MNKETLRMQMLAGVITEGQYKAKLEKLNSTENKDSLNENFIGMGAINNPFAERKKEKYEDAFEHFLSSKYTINEEIDEEQVEEEESFEDVSLDEIEEDKETYKTINIPQEYSALRNILGDKSSSNNIIKMYNERVVPEMGTISLEVYEDGYFWNKVMDDIMVDTILSQLNSILS